MDEKPVFLKKVDALSFLLFFIGVTILFFLKWLPIWAAAAASAFVAVTLRQFLVGKIVDIFVSLFIFAALFFFNSHYPSETWTGIFLMIGSGYGFVRICFEIYSLPLPKPIRKKWHSDFKDQLDELSEDEDPKD